MIFTDMWNLKKQQQQNQNSGCHGGGERLRGTQRNWEIKMYIFEIFHDTALKMHNRPRSGQWEPSVVHHGIEVTAFPSASLEQYIIKFNFGQMTPLTCSHRKPISTSIRPIT